MNQEISLQFYYDRYGVSFDASSVNLICNTQNQITYAGKSIGFSPFHTKIASFQQYKSVSIN